MSWVEEDGAGWRWMELGVGRCTVISRLKQVAA